LLTADFEIGHFFRESIIPRAVLYFTGEALEDDEDDDEVCAAVLFNPLRWNKIFVKSPCWWIYFAIHLILLSSTCIRMCNAMCRPRWIRENLGSATTEQFLVHKLSLDLP